MNRNIILFLGFTLTLLSVVPLNAGIIETNNGQIYMNATVFDKKVNGVVIKYVDENDFDHLKFINFKNLPANLQKEYGYKKGAANAYDAKHQQWMHNQYAEAELEKKQNAEMLELIGKVQQQVQSSAIEIQFEANTVVEQGTIGRCLRIYPNGAQIDEGFILLYGQEFASGGGYSGDGVNRGGGGTWGGYVCPLNENIANNGENLPCYAETDLAFQILLNRAKQKLALNNKGSKISNSNSSGEQNNNILTSLSGIANETLGTKTNGQQSNNSLQDKSDLGKTSIGLGGGGGAALNNTNDESGENEKPSVGSKATADGSSNGLNELSGLAKDLSGKGDASKSDGGLGELSGLAKDLSGKGDASKSDGGLGELSGLAKDLSGKGDASKSDAGLGELSGLAKDLSGKGGASKSDGGLGELSGLVKDLSGKSDASKSDGGLGGLSGLAKEFSGKGDASKSDSGLGELSGLAKEFSEGEGQTK